MKERPKKETETKKKRKLGKETKRLWQDRYTESKL